MDDSLGTPNVVVTLTQHFIGQLIVGMSMIGVLSVILLGIRLAILVMERLSTTGRSNPSSIFSFLPKLCHFHLNDN